MKKREEYLVEESIDVDFEILDNLEQLISSNWESIHFKNQLVMLVKARLQIDTELYKIHVIE